MVSYPNPVVVSAEPPRRPKPPPADANEACERLTRAAAIMRQTILRNVPSSLARRDAEGYLARALSFAIEGVRRGG
jgi:hypothetical protein